jgi:hypothetical protein
MESDLGNVNEMTQNWVVTIRVWIISELGPEG